MRVSTLGTFDLFHRGHVNLLMRCRAMARGGEVVVGLNLDEFIEEFKGRPPVVDYADRAAVLRACRYVDLVVPNIGKADSKPILMSIRPDLLVVGSDWKDKDYNAQINASPEWLAERGIRLVYLPYTAEISTTLLRGRM